MPKFDVILTPTGWRPVESVGPGDLALYRQMGYRERKDSRTGRKKPGRTKPSRTTPVASDAILTPSGWRPVESVGPGDLTLYSQLRDPGIKTPRTGRKGPGRTKPTDQKVQRGITQTQSGPRTGRKGPGRTKPTTQKDMILTPSGWRYTDSLSPEKLTRYRQMGYRELKASSKGQTKQGQTKQVQTNQGQTKPSDQKVRRGMIQTPTGWQYTDTLSPEKLQLYRRLGYQERQVIVQDKKWQDKKKQGQKKPLTKPTDPRFPWPDTANRTHQPFDAPARLTPEQWAQEAAAYDARRAAQVPAPAPTLQDRAQQLYNELYAAGLEAARSRIAAEYGAALSQLGAGRIAAQVGINTYGQQVPQLYGPVQQEELGRAAAEQRLQAAYGLPVLAESADIVNPFISAAQQSIAAGQAQVPLLTSSADQFYAQEGAKIRQAQAAAMAELAQKEADARAEAWRLAMDQARFEEEQRQFNVQHRTQKREERDKARAEEAALKAEEAQTKKQFAMEAATGGGDVAWNMYRDLASDEEIQRVKKRTQAEVKRRRRAGKSQEEAVTSAYLDAMRNGQYRRAAWLIRRYPNILNPVLEQQAEEQGRRQGRR